jgi:hypothetical protein
LDAEDVVDATGRDTSHPLGELEKCRFEIAENDKTNLGGTGSV